MKVLRFFYIFASLVVVSMNGGWGADLGLNDDDVSRLNGAFSDNDKITTLRSNLNSTTTSSIFRPVQSVFSSQVVQQARTQLENLSRCKGADESKMITQFQIIANLMDSYNKTSDQLLAPYNCEYLVAQNARDDNDMSSYRVWNFGNSPLLLGLVVKYDAQVALLRGDRMRHLNLSKAIHDIWIAGTYGLKEAPLTSRNTEYLKGTDYEAACVMDFAFRNIMSPNMDLWIDNPSAVGITSSGKRGFLQEEKWKNLCQTAKFVNSQAFVDIAYKCFDENKSKNKTEVKNFLEVVASEPRAIGLNKNMLEYVMNYFQNYVKKFQTATEKSVDVVVMNCGSGDGTTFNTCGVNSLFREDAIKGNLRSLRKELCSVLKRQMENDPFKGDGIDTFLKTEFNKTFESFISSDEMLNSIKPQSTDLIVYCLIANFLEKIAFAMNSNCTIIKNDDGENLRCLAGIKKAASFFSPFLPMKFIYHSGAHYQRVLYGRPKENASFERLPADVSEVYPGNPIYGYPSQWYRTVVAPL